MTTATVTTAVTSSFSNRILAVLPGSELLPALAAAVVMAVSLARLF